ncbi:hypothetical protein EYD10_04721 [Varanus komodoensis]|nr:hypothetical protein EYD10_04721 [Varanus komodoensis]
MMEVGRQGRQRASETIRKQKRKELDARRSKCRIRIGTHLEQWCRLKEQLGFSLHSQLAKYLLDRYSSPSSVLKTGQDNATGVSAPLPPDALQHLVVLSHNHSQECGFIPSVKSSLLEQRAMAVPGSSMVWECLAGHTFSWSPPPAPQTCRAAPRRAASRGSRDEAAERAVSPKPSPPPSPAIRRRRSLRRAAAAHAFSLALASDSPCPVDEAEPSPREDGEGGADRESAACMSPGSGAGPCEEAELLSGTNTGETAAPSEEIPESTELIAEPESTLTAEEETPDQPEEGGEGEAGEDLAEEDDLAYTDDLRDENYHPSLDRYGAQGKQFLLQCGCGIRWQRRRLRFCSLGAKRDRWKEGLRVLASCRKPLKPSREFVGVFRCSVLQHSKSECWSVVSCSSVANELGWLGRGRAPAAQDCDLEQTLPLQQQNRLHLWTCAAPAAPVGTGHCHRGWKLCGPAPNSARIVACPAAPHGTGEPACAAAGALGWTWEMQAVMPTRPHRIQQQQGGCVSRFRSLAEGRRTGCKWRNDCNIRSETKSKHKGCIAELRGARP